MIKLFTDITHAQTFCDACNDLYGSNYTGVNVNSSGDQWLVQVLKSDYDALSSDDQYGYVSKLPEGFYSDDI